MSKTHELKSWPGFYREVEKGNKTLEVRRNDRNYQPGDLVIFKEFVPPWALPEVGAPLGHYTGRELPVVRIKYVLRDAECPDGLKPGFCAFAFEPVV